MNRIELSDRIAQMWLKSRSDAGWSQDRVAKALGVSKKTVQNWESGEASPNFRIALEWFDALGVPMYPYIMELLYPDEIEGITDSIVTHYEIATELGILQNKEHIAPDVSTLERFLDTARGAVREGKQSYTFMEEQK